MVFGELNEHHSSPQSQAWTESCEAVRRGRHALHCLLKYREADTQLSAALVTSHCRALSKALQPTPFGQAFDTETTERLLSVAAHVELPAGTVIKEEEDSPDAGLYIILGGTVEVIRTEQMEQKGAVGRRLRVSIESVTLESAKIDPELKLSCALSHGKNHAQTLWIPRAEDEANIEWHFVGSLPYEGEQPLVVTLMGCKDNDDEQGIAVAFGTIEAHDVRVGFDGNLNLTAVLPEHSAEDEGPDGFLGTVQISVSSLIERRKASKSQAMVQRRTVSIESNDGAKSAPQATPGSISISALIGKRKTPTIISKAQPRVSNGQTFGPGDYFSSVGAAVICSGACEFLKVQQADLMESLCCIANERSQHRDAFLKKWLPGIENVDAKAVENLSPSFQLVTFPKNHVFCTAGTRSRESPHVFLLVQGECRMIALQQKQEIVCGIDAVQRVVPRREQVGLVGEGQLLGFSSALFGAPEPFTAIASSEVKAYVWSGSGERTAAGWPRELLKPLAGDLKMHVAHQRRREGNLMAAGRDMISGDREDSRSSLPGLRDSPFLRNKDISKSWKVKALQDHCAEWSPADANAKRTCMPPSPSMPSLMPSANRAGRSSHQPRQQVREHRLPNLKNPTDWGHMTQVASTSAMMKMYKQRVRLGAAAVPEAGRSVVDFARTTVGRLG